jgi:hypothetical protein
LQGVPYDQRGFTQGYSTTQAPIPSVYAQTLSALGSLGSAYALSQRS